jgi:hypothetical protein
LPSNSAASPALPLSCPPPPAAEEFKRTSTVKTGLIQAVSDCLGGLDSLEYTLVKANELAGAAGSRLDAAAAAHEMLASGQAAGVGSGLGAGLGAGMGMGVLGPNNNAAVTGAAAMVGVTGLAVL